MLRMEEYRRIVSDLLDELPQAANAAADTASTIITANAFVIFFIFELPFKIFSGIAFFEYGFKCIIYYLA